MAINPAQLSEKIETELRDLPDARIAEHIRSLLIAPTVEMREWSYGEPGQHFPCWLVFSDKSSGTGIAYCEEGFGPTCPWGLLWLKGSGGPLYMGPDSSWFPTFVDAYFDSFASDNFDAGH